MTLNSIHYPAINREQSFFRDWSGKKNAQIEKLKTAKDDFLWDLVKKTQEYF